MVAGNDEPLTFELGKGETTARHGRGSCHIRVTHETDSAKRKMPDSWKVINGITGGSLNNARGNL